MKPLKTRMNLSYALESSSLWLLSVNQCLHLHVSSTHSALTAKVTHLSYRRGRCVPAMRMQPNQDVMCRLLSPMFFACSSSPSLALATVDSFKPQSGRHTVQGAVLSRRMGSRRISPRSRSYVRLANEREQHCY